MNLTEHLSELYTALKKDLGQSIERSIQNAFQHSGDAREKDELLTITEAALLLKRPKKTLYALVAKREIPHIKQGRQLTFIKSELVSWLKTYRVRTLRELQSEMERQFLSLNTKERRL